MPSQQPDGQLQKQHNTQTYIIKGNELGTYETYTHIHTKLTAENLKSLIGVMMMMIIIIIIIIEM
jgi:hypothetical protein